MPPSIIQRAKSAFPFALVATVAIVGVLIATRKRRSKALKKLSPLHSARLILRDFQASDSEVFYNYRSDPVVARFQGWDFPYNFDDSTAFLERNEVAHWALTDSW